jgi:uncharacterized protein (DUF3084 family)
MRNPFTNKRFAILFSIAFIMLLLFVLMNLKPALVGYSIYRQVQETNYSLEDYGEKLSIIRGELSELKASGSALKSELDAALSELQKTRLEAASLNLSLKELQELRDKEKASFELYYLEKIGELNTRVDKLTTELGRLENDYERLVKNTAQNICCKQKVDNPAINSYDVKSNRIVCSSEGKSALKCNF